MTNNRLTDAGHKHAPVPIAVAYGDGIGPEIMSASLNMLEAAGARLAPEVIEIGEKVYRSGETSGIRPAAWDVLRRTKVFYKAPITTPQGGGYKSLNVTVRKSLGLFANVRPCAALTPFIPSVHPHMDLVIVRENEEDLYAGIEHRQTDEVYQCLKLISRPGCERLIRYAFEYARANGRKKVSCFSKDNIMKLTDGLFHKVFTEIAADYPDIETDHWIIDIGTARLANRPYLFDVIVTLNLYGDIISDVAAEISGSVGIGASANVGEHCAMFEAIHGSAPDIAGKGIANPSGLVLAGVQMLNHIGQSDAATRLHNAWLRTIEDGMHTADIFHQEQSTRKVGTAEFAEAVMERMGQGPKMIKPVDYGTGVGKIHIAPYTPRRPQEKVLTGIDVFVAEQNRDPEELATRLAAALQGHPLELTLITNRGIKVWPQGLPETFRTDHWRCRLTLHGPGTHQHLAEALLSLAKAGIEFVKTEHLYTFDGEPGFSLGQGQ